MGFLVYMHVACFTKHKGNSTQFQVGHMFKKHTYMYMHATCSFMKLGYYMQHVNVVGRIE